MDSAPKMKHTINSPPVLTVCAASSPPTAGYQSVEPLVIVVSL
jgi:hypothetical protein